MNASPRRRARSATASPRSRANTVPLSRRNRSAAEIQTEHAAEVMQCDKGAFARFFHAMLERGVYFAPSAYEAGFVSAAHSEADIAATIAAADAALGSMS